MRNDVLTLTRSAVLVAVLASSVSFTGCQLLPESLKSMLGLSGGATATSADSMSQEQKEAKSQELFTAGVQAAEAGNKAEAIAKFEEVLTIFPKHVAANTNLGLAYAQQEKWEDAQRAFDRVLAEEPDNPDANANLAWVLAEQELWPQALERGLKAARLSPQNPYVFNTLGWVYTQTEQPDEAINAYKTAVQLDPSMASVWKDMGLLHCRLGHTPEAQDALTHLTSGSDEANALSQAIGAGCVAQ